MDRNTWAVVWGLAGRLLARQGWLAILAVSLFGFNAHASSLATDDCLFNWAEGHYPNLFSAPTSPTAVLGVYTYRYYSATNTYLGVSSADNNVYYLGPDGKLQNEGPLSDWLPKASCPTPAPPQIDCLFDWAERSYPGLFVPAGSPATVSDVYTYRHYAGTKTWLWVSSIDNHVYFMGPDGKPQDEGRLLDWLPNVGCQNVFGKPSFPIIFIHGLNSSALAWAEASSSFKDFLVKNGGWTFGGTPTYDTTAKKVNGILGSGDFYTLDFSVNPYFGLDLQGGELSAIIQAVLSNNPGKGKVILVAHSMGGLVAREYLQGLSRDFGTLQYIPYRGDVDKLITVGTPHQGSDIAAICSQYRIICEWLGYDPSSAAIADLRPGSVALNTLNNMQAHPLPGTVAYYSIIGRGADTITSTLPLNFEGGDFIVTLISQNLSKISGALQISTKSVTLDIANQGACDYQGITVLHRCEPADPNVWEAILLDL